MCPPERPSTSTSKPRTPPPALAVAGDICGRLACAQQPVDPASEQLVLLVVVEPVEQAEADDRRLLVERPQTVAGERAVICHRVDRRSQHRYGRPLAGLRAAMPISRSAISRVTVRKSSGIASTSSANATNAATTACSVSGDVESSRTSSDAVRTSPRRAVCGTRRQRQQQPFEQHQLDRTLAQRVIGMKLGEGPQQGFEQLVHLSSLGVDADSTPWGSCPEGPVRLLSCCSTPSRPPRCRWPTTCAGAGAAGSTSAATSRWRVASPRRDQPDAHRAAAHRPAALRRDRHPAPLERAAGQVARDHRAHAPRPARSAAEVLRRAGEQVAPGRHHRRDRRLRPRAVPSSAAPTRARSTTTASRKSVCTSVNEVICHGIPDARALQDGDIVNLDVTAYLDGVHGDTNATFFVGDVDEESRSLVRVTEECMWHGIEAVAPGRPVNDIGRAIEDHARRHRYGVVRAFIGHGIGEQFHADLQILHYYDAQGHAPSCGRA